MRYQAALYVEGFIQTGCNHGDCFSRLTEEQKNSDNIISGFITSTGKFIKDIPNMIHKALIIRHGESTFNSGKTPNDYDSPLTEKGITQIKKLSQFLSTLNLNNMVGYVSPFLRCLMTADIIKSTTNIKFNVITEVSEYTQDWPFDFIQIKNTKEQFNQFCWENDKNFTFIKETDEKFIARLKNSVDKLAENAIIVTHGLPALVLTKMLAHQEEKMPIWENQIPNGSITEIEDGHTVYVGKEI